jgi:serine/threonine-protein kinase PRP4
MQEAIGNGADVTTLQAPALPTHSSSKDIRKSVPGACESEGGGNISSDAEDTKGHEQSQRISQSLQLRTKHKDDHHTSSSKDSQPKDRSKVSPCLRHHREAHAKGHSRSREKGAEANGPPASPRGDSDPDIKDQNRKSDRHSIRSRESERERGSSRVARDGYRHDRVDRRHSSNVIDRDKVDSREAAHSRHRERSSSRNRSDLRESAHFRDESCERERRSGSSRHKDYERKRVTSKDRHRESDRVDRDKVREDRDREWQRVKGSEARRSGEGRDKVSNNNRHRDSTRSKYITSDGYNRSEERSREVGHKNRISEEMKGSSFR